MSAYKDPNAPSLVIMLYDDGKGRLNIQVKGAMAYANVVWCMEVIKKQLLEMDEKDHGAQIGFSPRKLP
jgi:hypothetical protein